MNQQFARDVREGLRKNPKQLPSKYFYDEVGDQLFVKIMAMPEYYLTRAEMDIFQNQTDELIDAFSCEPNKYFEFIELGAGDGTKTREVLKRLTERGFNFDYLPVDISQHALDGLKEMLADYIPSCKVVPQQGDYFEILSSLKKSNHPKVVLFLGSNIGNMSDERAADFIYQLGSNLQAGDRLLLGVDLIKSKDIVLPAYNDPAGITRDFNLNLLHRMNSELEANFDLSKWSHTPEYEENEGIAKSFLRSDVDQSVTIGALDETFDFASGEKIHTEISRKYNDEVISKIIANTDFKIEHRLTDSNQLFADYILKRL